MKKNVSEKNVKGIVRGWAKSYAGQIDDKVREHLSNYADDVADAFYRHAVKKSDALLSDVNDGVITPTQAKGEFKSAMKEFYTNLVDGAQID